VPGKAAPMLITEEAVAGMKRGSVVIDLAGTTGGNCALSKPDEVVEVNGVTVLCPLNVAATIPVHASQLYSRHLTSFLSLMVKDGALNLDFNDDIIAPSCAVHQGHAKHPRVQAAFNGK